MYKAGLFCWEGAIPFLWTSQIRNSSGREGLIFFFYEYFVVEWKPCVRLGADETLAYRSNFINQCVVMLKSFQSKPKE